MDDVARMSDEAQRKTFLLTLKAIYRRFGLVYLNCRPIESELRSLVNQYDARGFPVCVSCGRLYAFTLEEVPHSI